MDRRPSKEKEDVYEWEEGKEDAGGQHTPDYIYTFAFDGLSLGGGGAVRQAAVAVGRHGVVFDRCLLGSPCSILLLNLLFRERERRK